MHPVIAAALLRCSRRHAVRADRGMGPRRAGSPLRFLTTRHWAVAAVIEPAPAWILPHSTVRARSAHRAGAGAAPAWSNFSGRAVGVCCQRLSNWPAQASTCRPDRAWAAVARQISRLGMPRGRRYRAGWRASPRVGGLRLRAGACPPTPWTASRPGLDRHVQACGNTPLHAALLARAGDRALPAAARSRPTEKAACRCRPGTDDVGRGQSVRPPACWPPERHRIAGGAGGADRQRVRRAWPRCSSGSRRGALADETGWTLSTTRAPPPW